MTPQAPTSHFPGIHLGTGEPIPAMPGHVPVAPDQNGMRDHPDRPIMVVAVAAGNQYGRMYQLQQTGDFNVGHRHTFDHHTWLVSGGVRVESPVFSGEVWAPAVLIVPAEHKHQFTALVDNTIYICTHQLSADAAACDTPLDLIRELVDPQDRVPPKQP